MSSRTNNWTQDLNVLGDILILRRKGSSWEDIFFGLQEVYPDYNFSSPESVRKRFNESHYRLADVKEYLQEESLIDYNEAYKQLCDYINKKQEVKQPTAKAKKETKILVMSDLHIPFHNIEVMKKIVAQHKDADRLIIPGDILDCYSVSRFSKKKNFPLKDELSSAVAVIDWLASVFPQIDLLEGNHTDRVRKYFEARIDQDLMFLVKYDLLELIAHPYKNVNVIKDEYKFKNGNGAETISYFMKLGKDCIIGHFETSSKAPLKASITAYEWLKSWSNYFGIDNIRLFLQGHTHRISKYPIGDGSTIVGETGCVAQIQDYAIDSGAKYSAHLNGYWVVYQQDGVTDINKSNFYIV